MSQSILPLRLDGLCYHFNGVKLIKDISYEFSPKGRTVILGPNGAGKSMLLRLCHGLLEPSDGQVLWAGGDVKEAREAQAMVFQRPVLLRRTAGANIHYALSLRGLGKQERAPLVKEALQRVGLARFANQPARLLSGGEQQRLALARVWALNPQVLFLDEPTASLDPAATVVVEEVIEAMTNRGTKIIMTTHDMGQAKRLGDDVLFLARGRLVETSPAEAFFEQPATEPARAFLNGEIVWRKKKPLEPRAGRARDALRRRPKIGFFD